MLKASCNICFENFPLHDFRVYSCGHCFCISCISKLREQNASACSVCRKKIASPSGSRIYLTVTESNSENTEYVVEGIKRLGPNSEAKSVKRAAREIEKVVRNTAANSESDALPLLLEEINRFKEQILPLFEARESLTTKVASLGSELSTLNNLNSELSFKTRILESEAQHLQSQLRDARRVTEDAVIVAEHAKDAAMHARNEKAACLAKSEEDKLARESQEDEIRKLKVWLEQHKKEARLMKDKFRALKKQRHLATAAESDSDVESSLRIAGPIKPPQTNFLEDKRRVFSEVNTVETTSSPHRDTSPVLNPSDGYRGDSEYMPRHIFPSEWQLAEQRKRRRRRFEKTVMRFPIELDEKGHVKGAVRLGSRHRGVGGRN